VQKLPMKILKIQTSKKIYLIFWAAE